MAELLKEGKIHREQVAPLCVVTINRSCLWLIYYDPIKCHWMNFQGEDDRPLPELLRSETMTTKKAKKSSAQAGGNVQYN